MPITLNGPIPGTAAYTALGPSANSSGSQFTITIAALTAAGASFASYDCVAGHN